MLSYQWSYCDSSAQAVKRIYEIKGRQQTSPLAISVADVSAISRFAILDHLPPGLLDCLLPGPVTVVLSRGLYDTSHAFFIYHKFLESYLHQVILAIWKSR